MISEAAKIDRTHDLEDRMNILTKSSAFITVIDLEDTFSGGVDCRLINPAINHIGAISKSILDRINIKLRESTGSNQWKSKFKDPLSWACKDKISTIMHCRKSFLFTMERPG